MTAGGTPRPGLEGVVAADSAISSIDGAKGELRYRGYLVEELARHATFPETAYLLWHGELPTRAQLDRLEESLRASRRLPEAAERTLREAGVHQAAMAALRTAVSAASICDEREGVVDRESNLARAVQLTAKAPAIVASWHALRAGREPLEPREDLSHAGNFLYMLLGEAVDAEVERMFDVCLVLHAEHGLNASTFAARVTAATLSDMFAAVTSAIGALQGPLHGGANTAVMKMLLEIGEPEAAARYVDEKLARGERIMGFGHRVYKVLDPRARILEEFSRRMAEITGESRWYEISKRVQERVKERKGIDPNVDFYSASTYYAMGIPPELFTCVFAISRMAGWTAHVVEQHENNRLIRPRANYVGPAPRPWVPMDRRG